MRKEKEAKEQVNFAMRLSECDGWQWPCGVSMYRVRPRRGKVAMVRCAIRADGRRAPMASGSRRR